MASASPARGSRRHDLDHLRVLAFVVLVVAHAANLFVGWGSWPLRSGHVSWGLERLMLFVCLWRLPLVFFIAGAGAAYSLAKRDAGGFLWERVGRLLPPLAMGIFFIAPLQTWMEGRVLGHVTEDFLSFLPRVWMSGPAPDGMLGWQHLWFVGYLLVLSAVLAGVHALLKRDGGRVMSRVDRIVHSRPGLLALGLIPAGFTAGLAADHPPTYMLHGDWWNLSQSLFFLAAGWLAVRSRGLLARIEDLRWAALQLGLLSVGLLFTQDWLGIRTFWWWDADWHFFAKGVGSWAWVLALVGFAARYLNRPLPLLKAANEAVFPFFIWHLVALWGVGMALGHTDWGFWVEFPLAVGGTLLGTAAIVYLTIHPFDLMRVAFGMTPRRPLLTSTEDPSDYSTRFYF